MFDPAGDIQTESPLEAFGIAFAFILYLLCLWAILSLLTWGVSRMKGSQLWRRVRNGRRG